MTEVLAAVGSAVNIDEALKETITAVAAESGTIHLLREDGNLHLCAGGEGIPEAVRRLVQIVPVGKGMAGLAVLRREPVSACNIQSDTSGDVRPGAKQTGLEGAVVVPIMRDGVAVGALGVANRRERTFTEQELSLLMEIGRILAAKYGG